MARASNVVLGCLNLLAFVAALLLLAVAVWVSAKPDTHCERRLLQIPAYAAGGALLLLSIVGFFGACFRVKGLLVLYLIALLVLVLAYAGFAVFVVVVAYRAGDPSSWLSNRVHKPSTWRTIQSCLVRAHVCRDLQIHNYSEAQFYALHLSSLQSGCCTSPHDCNFEYRNATFWTGSSNSADEDCQRWSNDQAELCYSCDSCKTGVLHYISSKWKAIAIASSLVIVILILVCSLACCALYNGRHRRQLRDRLPRK